MHDTNKQSSTAQLSTGAKLLAGVFLLIAVCAVVLAVYFSSSYTHAVPILATAPADAQQQVQGMMDAVCAGDFEKASSYVYGNPSIGVDRQSDSEAGVIIWDAFVESTSYELTGQCYATEDGLAQNITFTCMDFNSVNKNLRERSQDLLKKRVEEAADTSEIYDENNEYREDVVNQVLKEAVCDALEEDATTITTTVTVQLKYENDRWWVVADQELLDILFGDVLFYST